METLVGKRFNRWFVLAEVEHNKELGKNRFKHKCVCDCGKIKNVAKDTLLNGRSQSCGCLAIERSKKVTKKKHNRNTASYRSWCHMKGRCNNPDEVGYENYGGRGIKICEEWDKSYDTFIDDVGYAPEGYVADRINPNGDYCKENFRWVNRSLSSFNTRKASNNTSGKTGIYWFNRTNKWMAAIHVENTQIHLGFFNSFQEAVDARLKAEIEYFNELKKD